jgi:hypothetical protein
MLAFQMYDRFSIRINQKDNSDACLELPTDARARTLTANGRARVIPARNDRRVRSRRRARCGSGPPCGRG